MNKINITNAYKTEKGLLWFLENPGNISEIEEHLDRSFFDSHEIDEKGLFDLPYWIESGSIDYGINGIYMYEYSALKGEYISGYHEPYSYGETYTVDGKEYKYISSIPLSEEIEHQAESGALCYEYRGSSFIRIWEPVDKIIDEYPTI